METNGKACIAGCLQSQRLLAALCLMLTLGCRAEAQDPQRFDAAPFARVIYSNPNVQYGCVAPRDHEFRTGDLFREEEMRPSKEGTYTVQVAGNHRGSIGLDWVQRRFLKELAVEFDENEELPSPEGVSVGYWADARYPVYGGITSFTEQSRWQGQWIPLPEKIETNGRLWRVPVRLDFPVQKVRWVFRPSRHPLVIRSLNAFTDSRMAEVRLTLEVSTPMPGTEARVTALDGTFVAAGKERVLAWDLRGPVQIALRYVAPKEPPSQGPAAGDSEAQKPKGVDRTLLSFEIPATGRDSLPKHCFAVAVDEVLDRGSVYLPQYGIAVSRPGVGAPFRQGDRRTSETVLERVRKMPDQTFQAALEKVHDPMQNEGHSLLSLAAGNEKFVVERLGAIQFSTVPDKAAQSIYAALMYPYRFFPIYGEGSGVRTKRELQKGWLPIPISTVEDSGVIYRQTTFVAPYGAESKGVHPWLRRRPLCVASITVENPNEQAGNASIHFGMTTVLEPLISHFFAERGRSGAPIIRPVDRGFVLQEGERLLAFIDTGELSRLKCSVAGNQIEIKGTLPGRTQARCQVYIPGWGMKPDEYNVLHGGTGLLTDVEAYWQEVMAPALQVKIPDQLLQNIILASQVHCLLATRNEDGGTRFAPWISAMSYAMLESEGNSIIRGMDLMGHANFARRALELYVRYYTPEGSVRMDEWGYTLMGTGWHLWTLGEHNALNQDQDWLRGIAPEVARACAFVLRQLEKTKRLDPRGERLPEYGLVPPGVSADWDYYAYRFMAEGIYCAGLRSTASALARIQHPGAEKMLSASEAFSQDILRAFQWSQARNPALPLPNGTWVQPYPSNIYVDAANHTRTYDTEIGAHHLLAHGILDLRTPEARAILDHMEDVAFLQYGGRTFSPDRCEQDWFNLGGFSKSQPYYTRMPQIYALLDDVKPFIRSYFNTIPTVLSLENLCFWEGPHQNGAWNKTHETGYFLEQTRSMLLMERGEELWIAPLVTANWLKDGMEISVGNAPSTFGKVGYQIRSAVATGTIEVLIDPPQKSKPAQICVRLRHPEGKQAQRAEVSGGALIALEAAAEVIRVRPDGNRIWLRVHY